MARCNDASEIADPRVGLRLAQQAYQHAKELAQVAKRIADEYGRAMDLASCARWRHLEADAAEIMSRALAAISHHIRTPDDDDQVSDELDELGDV